ncbi:MAG: hypothetical protein AAB387_01570, partial [candidate division NC10 bacterium]
TLLRGGVGKFYEYQLISVEGALLQQAVTGPSFLFDTGQNLSANQGVIPQPTASNPGLICLQPTGSAGLAVVIAAPVGVSYFTAFPLLLRRG